MTRLRDRLESTLLTIGLLAVALSVAQCPAPKSLTETERNAVGETADRTITDPPATRIVPAAAPR